MKQFAGILIIFYYSLASAQVRQPVGAGLIIDAGTFQPIEGVSLCFNHGKEWLTTNDEGRFYLNRQLSPSDSIAVSAIGYDKKIFSYRQFLENGDTIRLNQQTVRLREMVVVSGMSNPTQVLGKLDIRLRGINNSQEVLRMVPGLFIGQHAGGGKAEQIFLRGFDIDHGTDISISVDGMPVNMVSHAHGQGYADLHFVIPELMDRVDFKKGPYDASKGNFATAGFVALNTKNVLQGNSIKVEAGQYQSIRTVVMINLMKKESRNWYAAGEFLHSNGYFDHPQNLGRVNLFTKFNTGIGKKSTLQLSASAFRSKWNASGQIPDRAVADGSISYYGAIDPDEGGATGRANINAQMSTNISGSSVVKNQFYFSDYDIDLFSNFSFFLNDPVNGDQIRQKEKRSVYGYHGSYANTRFAGDKMMTTEAGISLRADKIRDSELSRTKDRNALIEPLQHGDIMDLNTSVYVNEKIQLSKLFSASAGLRVDHFRVSYEDHLNKGRSGSSVNLIASPKLNLFYHPGKVSEIYLSMGKGFHSNDTRVVLGGQTGQALPAAYGTDLGANIKMGSKLFLHTAAWYLFLDQEFIYVGDEGIVEPGGKTIRKGLDLFLRYQPFQKFFADADFSYAHARLKDAQSGQNFIPLAPAFTSSGGLSYRGENKWKGSLRYRYMANRPANEDYSLTARGYFIMDAVLEYAVRKFECSLRADNLLNTKWKETQFETESRLRHESASVREIHFTPGTPFFLRMAVTYNF
jgi:hypothetical protein